MYYYNRKKAIIKSGLIIGFILAIAVFATYHIYYKFEGERNVDYKSKTLDITFHQKTGNKVTLTKSNTCLRCCRTIIKGIYIYYQK